jgi:hypothetical protein
MQGGWGLTEDSFVLNRGHFREWYGVGAQPMYAID